jgi:hypothetical protein
MQFSSMDGRVGGSPGVDSYHADKFAIDGSAACCGPRPRRSASR